MNVAARVLGVRAAEPFDVPEAVRRIRAHVDWSSYLPPRACYAGWQAQRVVKRAMDVVLSLLALIALLPLFAVVAFAIRLTSRGPILYELRVLGRHARPFITYKFRTMVADADAQKSRYLHRNEMSGPVFKMRDDPRVTPLGRVLRRYSIDELPQLWSVLKGDLSLVGPRAPSAEEFARFEPWQWGKLAVTPGLTCLWQVSGRSDIRDFATWATLDLEYIQRWNLLLDLRVLVRTVPVVITARGAY
jgi:lipopolysaccharide/colanic/teichoic acid biosynthesis glycosyltransferase